MRHPLATVLALAACATLEAAAPQHAPPPVWPWDAVENVGRRAFRAIRVEIKDAPR